MSESLNFKWLIEFGSEKQDPKVIVEFYNKIQVIPNTKRTIFLAARASSRPRRRPRGTRPAGSGGGTAAGR